MENHYNISQSEFEEYNRQFLIHRLIFIGLILLPFFLIQFLISGSIKPTLFALPIVGTLILLKNVMLQREYSQFKTARYYFNENSFTMEIPEKKILKSFPYEDICVIDKKKFGTMIVKGNKWRKIDYYWPNIGSPVNNHDKIFIPSVTSSYNDIIGKLLKLTNKG